MSCTCMCSTNLIRGFPKGCVLLIGAYFAFAVRNVPTLYNESRWMAAAVYSNLTWSVLLMAFGYSIDSAASSFKTLSIVGAFGIWFSATGTDCIPVP